ncbi:type VII toxin-antitoxin system MntA family adenylyltransferase antitoxin [Sulfurirhabdus autotrophica]|uniref:Putative nucleotidyltransferase n=1 Tax=Sulfurirhabdus autotrophica TaxID=1706046 RepID=A0A4R3XYR6_9PROT|nr:nucleotidyltransferase domain-containing protein [Sulfurirhabdus autotrophica]TCV84252.1 putative nucleotidyltransferase [Sulfurirhabdus autotrophica]
MSTPHSLLKQTILDAISKHPDIRLAILFGSLASGKERKESDLDLAIDVGHTISASEKIALINELALAIARPIDLVDLMAVGEPLLGQILRHGRKILGEDRQYAELISRHLFDQSDFLPYRNRILAERRMAWIGK